MYSTSRRSEVRQRHGSSFAGDASLSPPRTISIGDRCAIWVRTMRIDHIMLNI